MKATIFTGIIFLTLTMSALSNSAEDAIKAENEKIRKDNVDKLLQKMEEAQNEMENHMDGYYMHDQRLGDVMIQIDAQLAPIQGMKNLDNPKSDRLNRYKEFKGLTEEAARKAIFEEEIKDLKKAVRKTKIFLSEAYDPQRNFVPVFKKLDEQEQNIKKLEGFTNAIKIIPKQSVLSKTMEENKPKTIVKPVAAKVTKNVKENVADMFKRLLTELDDSKTAKQALIEFNALIRKKTTLNYSKEDIEKLFSIMEKLLKGKDKSIISNAMPIFSHFAGKKEFMPLVFKTNLLKLIAPLLHNKDEEVIKATIDTFLYIADDKKDGIKAVLDSKVLKYMVRVFEIDDDDLSFKSLGLLAKITANGKDAVEAIFEQDKNLFFFMVNYLGANHRQSRLPAYTCVIKTLEVSNEELTHGMIDMGAVGDLCLYFSRYLENDNVVLKGISALKNLIERSGNRQQEVIEQIMSTGYAHNMISDLQGSGNEQISELSTELIEKYLPDDDEADDEEEEEDDNDE